MNQWQFTGNLGNDAEAKTTNNGKAYVSFTVAVTEKFKDASGQKRENTTWVNCTYWNKDSNFAQYLTKGSKVLVTGKPAARAWMSNTDAGKAMSSLDCNVRDLEFLGGGKRREATGTDMPANNEEPTRPVVTQDASQYNDDLPF